MKANPPDLAIISIEHLRDYSKLGKGWRNEADRNFPTSYFLVRLTNNGKGPFAGQLILEWADRDSDIDSNKFTNSIASSVPGDIIYPGDTISVGFASHRKFYSSGTHVKFHLVGVISMRTDLSSGRISEYSPISENNTIDNYTELTISPGRDILNGKIFDIK